MQERKKNSRQGAAMIVVLIVIMVVVMLSLSMLLVSYSLFHSSAKQDEMAQCKEITQSLSRSIEREITGVSYETYQQQRDGASGTGDDALWQYLRCNVAQTSWPYLNEDERGHTENFAYRYFDMNSRGTQPYGDVTVLMYWEGEKDIADMQGTILNVCVTCKKGNVQSTITTSYELTIEKYEESESKDTDWIEDRTINPDGNSILKNDKWKWSFAFRE